MEAHLVQVLYASGMLESFSNVISPITVLWLGLPAIAGGLLIMGLIRKELVLVGAVAIFGTANLALYFTAPQLITIALVNMHLHTMHFDNYRIWRRITDGKTLR